ncbi:hypothetical protein K488DRAFT_91541, partial [Vararia minispora EC-137]
MSSPAVPSATPQSYTAQLKLVHVFGGIYIWEFLTSLGFTWQLCTRQRRPRWSVAPYLASRLLALGGVVIEFAGFGGARGFDCILSWSAICLSSLLIVLRGIALWPKSPLVARTMVLIWLTNLSRSARHRGPLPSAPVCPRNTSTFAWGTLVNFIADLSLLCIMLAGVLTKPNGTRLWRVLCLQGRPVARTRRVGACRLTASGNRVAACRCMVVGFLNIDDAWNTMFQVPHSRNRNTRSVAPASGPGRWVGAAGRLVGAWEWADVRVVDRRVDAVARRASAPLSRAAADLAVARAYTHARPRVLTMPDIQPKLSPHHIIFLQDAWTARPAIPSVSSRQAWAAAHNVRPQAVHRFFWARTSHAKRHRLPLDTEYELAIPDPPLQPLPGPHPPSPAPAPPPVRRGTRRCAATPAPVRVRSEPVDALPPPSTDAHIRSPRPKPTTPLLRLPSPASSYFDGYTSDAP